MYRYHQYQCPKCQRKYERFLSQEEAEAQACECGARLQPMFCVPAAIRTDTLFMRGTDDGFGSDERSRRLARAKARAAGVNPEGKRFIPQLCRRGVTFDPMAWVDSHSDVKRRCKQEGWGCTELGIKEVSVDEPEKPYRVADDLVEQHLEKEIAGHDVTPSEKAKAREKVRERLSPVGGL